MQSTIGLYRPAGRDLPHRSAQFTHQIVDVALSLRCQSHAIAMVNPIVRDYLRCSIRPDPESAARVAEEHEP